MSFDFSASHAERAQLTSLEARLGALSRRYRTTRGKAQALAVREYHQVYLAMARIGHWHGEPDGEAELPEAVMPEARKILRERLHAQGSNAPGAWRPVVDHWGAFSDRQMPEKAVVIVDALVLQLHGKALRPLRGEQVIALKAGEAAKSMTAVSRLAGQTLRVSRNATVVAIGGGTIGDLATVFAHLLKRGVKLIHVPTTLLAAVDSSVGGKGAVNVGLVKNALGVFHCAVESWVCPEFFTTLSQAQRREGQLEAFKMALTNGEVWKRWASNCPDDNSIVRQARQLKERICRADPYEQFGNRTVLNFGHTFAHVIEALSRHRVRHGEAVGLGMLCALDTGVALGVTPPVVAAEVEAALPNAPRARERLARVLAGASPARIAELLTADKKGGQGGAVRMILLAEQGRWHGTTTWVTESVHRNTWSKLLTTKWRRAS